MQFQHQPDQGFIVGRIKPQHRAAGGPAFAQPAAALNSGPAKGWSVHLLLRAFVLGLVFWALLLFALSVTPGIAAEPGPGDSLVADRAPLGVVDEPLDVAVLAGGR